MSPRNRLLVDAVPNWPPRYIDKAGVELEGGWTSRDQPEGMHGDGSVRIVAPWVGEISSPAMKPGELLRWIPKYYCDIVNDTCGMHVHISTRQHRDYERLMSKQFDTMVMANLVAWSARSERLRGWATLKDRLAGRNDFCKKSFAPESQWWAKRKGDYDRYTQFNFCHGVHGTLEFRALPMFHHMSDALEAIKLFIACADGFIKASREAAPKEATKVLRIDLAEAA